jgi:hypothetical protein
MIAPPFFFLNQAMKVDKPTPGVALENGSDMLRRKNGGLYILTQEVAV